MKHSLSDKYENNKKKHLYYLKYIQTIYKYVYENRSTIILQKTIRVL